MLVREQNRRHKSLMVSLQEDSNNFIMKVENAEESLSLDIIIKAPEGIIIIDYFKWVIFIKDFSPKIPVLPGIFLMVIGN